MKKFLIAFCALVASSTMAFVFASTTSSSPTKEERQTQREARRAEAIDQMKAALATQSFTFYPTSYTLPYQNMVMTYDRTDVYLALYPTNMDISLPFEINQGREFLFTSQLTPYQDYKVKATKSSNNFIVSFQLENVSNSGMNTNFDTQSMNLGVHIMVNVLTGSAFMTITPDFSAAVTYEGNIVAN